MPFTPPPSTRGADIRDGRILVTGSAGHLGANLVRRLLDEGCRVRVLLRDGSNNSALDGLNVERVFGNLRDLVSCRVATQDVRWVYHCAAQVSTIDGDARHKRDIYDSNVLGTRNLLQASREAGVERCVVTGSFSAVGYDMKRPSRPSGEDEPVYPFARCMPYQTSKVATEHECLKAVAEGQDVVIATSCAILGPHDYKPSRMGETLIAFAERRLPAFIPGGFTFVAARDVVDGHIRAMDHGRCGQKYTLASGYVAMDELMGIFEEVTGAPRPRLKLPAGLMAGLSELSSFVLTRFAPNAPQRLTPGAVRILRLERHADISKAREELGYAPTPIRDAVVAAYEDFVARGLISRTRAA